MHVRIPPSLTFADLQVDRDPQTGEIEIDLGVLLTVAEANPGMSIETEDGICAALVAWYRAHRADGGAVDATMEQIAAEVEAEDHLGAWRVQIAPGRSQ